MIRLKLLLMLAPVLDGKIKILTLTEKQYCSKDNQIEKDAYYACSLSEFVQVKKVACYIITAKRASHCFVLEATNNSKNIEACLKYEAKAIRWGLNPSGDECHTSTCYNIKHLL